MFEAIDEAELAFETGYTNITAPDPDLHGLFSSVYDKSTPSIHE